MIRPRCGKREDQSKAPPVNNGILLALLAYATYAWSDAAIKALGGGLSVFEIGFFLALISGTCIVATTPRDEHWFDFWRMKRPVAVQARALSGVIASVLGVIAFTTIPLAEVYALIFLAPLFVTILSLIVLKEQVGPWRWFAVVAGFAGVMLVVQPGFRSLELGHFAAFAVAFLAAFSIILMRSLSGQETRTTMLGYLILYALIVNAAGIAFTGFTVPSWREAGILLIAGVFSALGGIGLLAATRLAPANQLAPAHYSQIVWAVILGALLFDEMPDRWAIAGLAIIACSGLLTVMRERIRLGSVKWNPFGRNRL